MKIDMKLLKKLFTVGGILWLAEMVVGAALTFLLALFGLVSVMGNDLLALGAVGIALIIYLIVFIPIKGWLALEVVKRFGK
jgi:hypothetical protein